MSTFAWDESIETGVPAIDRQHQTLFEAIGRLHKAFHEGRGKEVTGSMLEFFVMYAKTHFADEEACMRELGYPGYLEHKEHHLDLSERIHELKARCEAGDSGIPMEISIFISQYLREHIQKQDIPMAAYLKSHQLP